MRVPERLLLLGHPVSHSLSPRIQNAALDAAQIAARYEALDVDPASFEETLRALSDGRAAGNVTVPFKERAFAACKVVTPLARRVGAVNTWWVADDGLLHGDNTGRGRIRLDGSSGDRGTPRVIDWRDWGGWRCGRGTRRDRALAKLSRARLESNAGTSAILVRTIRVRRASSR
jgi:hypothetical protein